MQFPWQPRFLDALQELDAAEKPHGLYGVRLAHAPDPARLPTLTQVLLSPAHTDFIGKLGCQHRHSDAKRDQLSLWLDPTHAIEMRVFDVASTKVRHFGSSYRLDTHNRKAAAVPPWNLEKLVPKLVVPGYDRRHSPALSTCILVVAHAPTVKALHVLLGRALEENFVGRYAVTLERREWEDRYGRDFYTGLYLWTSESEGGSLRSGHSS